VEPGLPAACPPETAAGSPAGAISQPDRNTRTAIANANAAMTIKHHLAPE
jgi:hypothetical protein